jgi:acetyltransferase-like isoleucine patch superfamily enzyme
MRSSTTTARLAGSLRLAWTIVTILVVQIGVCGIATAPVVFVWSHLSTWPEPEPMRSLVLGLAVVPSYLAFALALMPVSALACRMLGWRSPDAVEMSIAEMGWPLLGWVRYMVAIHVVRVFAGQLLRGTPVWTAYLRLSGARIGRRVYVNSLGLSDYNLLELGEGVVIGADVHLAGHTVEAGVVKTMPVRLGRNVTIGVGSIVDIGVVAGDGCQVGALSLVPKHTTLEPGAVYAGIPVRRIH